MQATKVTYLALLLACTASTSRAQQTSIPVRTEATVTSRVAQAASNYGNVPLMFEANQGQADGQIKYMLHGKSYSVYLTTSGMLLSLHPSGTVPSVDAPSAQVSTRDRQHISPIHQRERVLKEAKSAILAIDLVGASRNPRILGEEPLSTKVNYFIGRDPRKWRRNVPTFGRIRYSNVYPGIDLVYYGNNHKIEYDFDVAPGADATKIEFSVAGADTLAVDSEGNLILTKDGTKLQFQMPLIYQTIEGKQSRLWGTYTLRDATHVGFTLGHYDSTKPLVIDPVLVYSSFLGGSSDTVGLGVAVNSKGNAYVTGVTDSPDFPLANIGAYSPTEFRMFLTEFDPSGSSLLFADYFGGTTGGDDPYAIALDSAGNVYVTGCTTSADFPLVTPYQSTFSGSQDAFLMKFSADGSSVVYSTYLGGSNLTYIRGTTSQIGTSISVDPAGEAVVTGFTQATDFPTFSAYQSSVSTDQFGNLGQYGFVTKFAADGASLVYSTYLAGSTYNVSSCAGCFPTSIGLGVATDALGNAYVTGITNTEDFPITPGALMTSSPADPLSDIGFVSKFTTSGGLAYSTYLGGTDSFLQAIAADGTGSAYVTGFASSLDSFPTTSTSICDPSAVSCNGTVVAKLDPTGSNLVYSTFLGTSNNMFGQAIQVDVNGNAFIVGSDLAFDLANPIEQYVGNGDIVIAEIDPSGSILLMSTFLGGQGLDISADSLAIDSNGAVYATGATESSDFPVTQSAFQTVLNGQHDAFIAKIDPAGSGPEVTIGPSSLQFASQNVGSTSASQTSTLRNMSSTQLTINSKNINGDFAETDDCGSTVAPASQCTFTITFTPTSSGARSGTLIVTDNTQIGSHSVTLTGAGVGVAPAVVISPETLNFAPSPLGTPSATQAVTFSNNGGDAVVISAIQVSGDFQNAGSDCGTVAPHAVCTVQVSSVPTSAGPKTGSLQFLDSASGSQVVTLSGSGMDFVTSAQSNTSTVSPGGTASYELNISPTGGPFSSAISMVCTGAPAFATCKVNPNLITPGGNSLNATVTVTTSAPLPANAGFANRQFPPSGTFMPFLLIGVLLISAGNGRRLRVCLASCTMLMFLLLVGCSGVSNGKNANSSTTPPGTYSLTVTATSGNLRHSTPLVLVVQ